MLIFFHHTGVDAAASEPDDTPLTRLREFVLDQPGGCSIVSRSQAKKSAIT